MITKWIVEALGGVVAWLGGVFPEWDPPVWLTDLPGMVTYVASHANDLDSWLPFHAALTGAALVLVSLGVAITAKVLRIASSYATLGGGSAG